MYIAMNRFKVKVGLEAEFEDVWRNRDSSLSSMKGFREFHLLRGPSNEKDGYTLYASHTVWESQDDFTAWTKSQSFRDSHRNAGNRKPSYIEAPQFEGFSIVEGA